MFDNGFYVDACGREQYDGEMANMQADAREERRQQAQQAQQQQQRPADYHGRHVLEQMALLIEQATYRARCEVIGNWMPDEAVYILAQQTITELLQQYPALLDAGSIASRIAQDAYLREVGR